MAIPTTLGKLGDPRAIPLLGKMIENLMRSENNDSDSSDGIFSSGGKDRLAVESCLALAYFIGKLLAMFCFCYLLRHSLFKDDHKAKEILMNGIKYEKTREPCLAVLCLCTDDKQYFEELEKMLIQGQSLDYMVEAYLSNHADKSPYVDKLLLLNGEIHTKKKARANDDDE